MNIKNHKAELLLVLLVLIQLIFMTYCFATKKVGYHSDEIWSYGLANSYDGAHIFKDADDNFINNNRWISGKVLSDYITVGSDSRFAYGHTVNNLVHDTHPPLYFLILHTICSLFPGKFSKWYAYVINMAAFVACMIGLYLFGRKLFKSSWASLILCFLYGFSLASFNTYMFLRMYSMTTAVTVWMVYFTYNIYNYRDKEPDKGFYRSIAALSILTFTGALLVHIYLTFAFFLAVCMCIYLLCNKRIKQLLVYMGGMLGAVAMSIAVFPATLSHLFSVADKELSVYQTPLWMDLRCCVFYFMGELFGITIEAKPSYLDIYIVEVLLVALVIGVPVLFVFRNEVWMKTFLSKFRLMLKQVPRQLSKVNWFIIFLIISIYLDVVMIAYSIDIMHMNILSDRYVVNLYPIIYSIVLCGIYYLTAWITKKICKSVENRNKIANYFGNAVLLVTTVLIFIFTYKISGCYYYFDNDIKNQKVSLSEISKDSDVIVSLKEYWLLTCLTYDLKDCNQFFACELDDITKLQKELETYSGSKSKYWITELPKNNEKFEEASVLEDIISIGTEIDSVISPDNPIIADKINVLTNFLGQTSFVNEITFVGHSYVFGRTVFVYKLD